MILDELRADEPFALALALNRRLTVVVGLGPERRAWLASAIADALAGRRTPLWGVAEFIGLRVDLADPLVVRSTSGVDPVIDPALWRPGGDRREQGSDDLWPSSSLPERSDGAGPAAAVELPKTVASAVVAPPGGLADDNGQGARRRWRRSAPGPRPGAAAAGAGPPSDGLTAGPSATPAATAPAPRHRTSPPSDEPPEVPPEVAVADPVRPAILDAPEPRLADPVLPPRPRVEVGGDATDGAPPLPARPAALDEPAPPDPGPRPVPADLPPKPEPPTDVHLVDPRIQRRVADLAREVADCEGALASARSAAAAVEVPGPADTAPVAAAMAALERHRAEAAAATVEARRLSERWVEAEAATQAGLAHVPPWLLESARHGVEAARREVAEAEADADAEPPLDLGLVDRLDAAHREVARLEARAPRVGSGRRRLQAAREEEAALLRQLGLPEHAALSLRLERSRQTAGAAHRLEEAADALADAEAVLAELQGPRDDAAAGVAAARLALVWTDVVAFLGHEPPDVLGALAERPSPESPAQAQLAAALEANGVVAPSSETELLGAAQTWLDQAGERAAATEAAAAEARHRAERVRQVELAVAAAQERHAEALAALAVANSAASARRAAAEGAARQALGRWRHEVESARATFAAALERWTAASDERARWSSARLDAEAEWDRARARHQAEVEALGRHRAAAREAARRRAEEDWEAAAAAVRAAHAEREEALEEWVNRRAEAQAQWEADMAAAVAERKRLETRRAEALAAQAAWQERHRPAPSLPELEELLLERLALNHTSGPAGAVPVVVDDALSSLPRECEAPLFDVLVRASATVQVVYLTDDPSIADLASRVEGASILAVSADG